MSVSIKVLRFGSIFIPFGLTGLVLLGQTLAGGGCTTDRTPAPQRQAPTPAPQGQALTELSGVYTVQQQSSNRYLDAHQLDERDWAVVTRPRQDNPTQKWIFSRVSDTVYTIQQQSNGRFLDAHDTVNKDYAVVTRAAQNNATQRWIVTKVPNSNAYTIQQQNTRRYMDAHQDQAKNWAVVTRPRQANPTQYWIIRSST
jgi:hypothetical protein